VTLIFIKCIFTNNSAEYSGGAIYSEKISTFINCTFYENKAEGDGGAIYGGGKILNSIFYNNTANEKYNDIKTTDDTEIDYSLINYIKGGADYKEHNIMGDPKFTDPENEDFTLCPDSPCINAGFSEINVGPVDLAGNPRIVGKGIDMGAFEFQGKK